MIDGSVFEDVTNGNFVHSTIMSFGIVKESSVVDYDNTFFSLEVVDDLQFFHQRVVFDAFFCVSTGEMSVQEENCFLVNGVL